MHRIYFLALHNASYGLTTAKGQALIDSALGVARSFAQEEAPALDTFLFKDDHEIVQAEHKWSEAKAAKRKEDKVGVATTASYRRSPPFESIPPTRPMPGPSTRAPPRLSWASNMLVVLGAG